MTYTVSTAGVTGELPAGLEFDQTRLLLHGTPEAAGPHTVTYTATNSQGEAGSDTATLEFMITIDDDMNPTFEAEPQPHKTYTAGRGDRTVVGVACGDGG